MPTFQITVQGKVQGVFFRQSTKEKALALGLTGEVWNNADGSVTIVVNGNIETITQLIDWCHTGPPRARVSEVWHEELPDTLFSGFQIIR